MGTARCYLVAHYPSDVLAALLVGSAAAAAAYLLVDAAWRRLGSARLHARDVRRRVARVGQVPAEVVGVDGAYAVQARARAQSQPQHVRAVEHTPSKRVRAPNPSPSTFAPTCSRAR
nr:hypothetical protein [Eggerthella sinensis]